MTENAQEKKKTDWKLIFKQALKAGLSYGLGLVAGGLLSILLFKIPGPIFDTNLIEQAKVVLVGFLLAFVIIGVSHGLAGFIGGRNLPVLNDRHSRFNYGWKSGLTMALLYGPLVFLAMFIISLFAYYYFAETPLDTFGFLFAVVGAVFGAFFGLIFGVSTIRWRGLGWLIFFSAIGFGIGGFGLGTGLWLYMKSVVAGVLARGSWWWLLLGIFWFGLAGGSAVGFVYGRYDQLEYKKTTGRNWFAIAGITISVLFVLLIGYVLNSVIVAVIDFIEPQSGNLETKIISNVVGTHWSDTTDLMSVIELEGGVLDPYLDVNSSGNLGMVWISDGGEVEFLSGKWMNGSTSGVLTPPQAVDNGNTSISPARIAIDEEGNTHIVWRSDAQVNYVFCQEEECSPPVPLQRESDLSCIGSSEQLTEDDLASNPPAIAINGDDQVMVSWVDPSGGLLYSTWSSTDPEESFTPETACAVESPIDNLQGVNLSGGTEGDFALVYQSGNEIEAAAFRSGAWASPQNVGKGDSPKVYLDDQKQAHFAWCNQDGSVSYRSDGEEVSVSDLPCMSRPELGMDNEGKMHIVWTSDKVEKVVAVVSQEDVIYESILEDGEWTSPMIVARLDSNTQPSMSNNPDGALQLVWSTNDDNAATFQYTYQVQYACDPEDLSDKGQELYKIASLPAFRDPSTDVPWCQNTYGRLFFTPHAKPEFTDEEPSPHGGFDKFNEMMQDAEYEVLLSTMEFDQDENMDSPGFVLAQGITELYHKVEANPENYPRGMLVRFVLGNPPRAEPNSDLWRVIDDLRKAGLPEMVNDDIGWKLEIGNYKGAWPHSHMKVMVIDGKTAVSTGFNYQYHHFPEDHPSGLGEGTFDLGVEVTGPVAQDVRFAFDELWNGAITRYCPDLYAPEQLLRFYCKDTPGVPTHVPEVMRYYPTDGTSEAFSMLRSDVLQLSDAEVTDVIASAEESVDVIEAMFAMPLGCYLNHLYDVCGPEQGLGYTQALIKAAKNGAHIRLLLKLTPFMGTEANVSIEVIEEALAELGIEDRVEIRAFPTALHAKTFSVDGKLVVIGSQNFHYTAFGPNQGLVEQNLGVVDPQLVEDWERVFNYWWDEAGKEDVYIPEQGK